MAKTVTAKKTVRKPRLHKFLAWLTDGTSVVVEGTHPMDAYDRQSVDLKIQIREIVDYIG